MTKNKSIYIKNIYYMLAYAFQSLKEESYKHIETETFQYTSDLLAAILAQGIANQIRRGLGREYCRQMQSLSSPRGKIDVTNSIKAQTLFRRQLICVYDEYSENMYMNQILKTTANLLLRCPDVALAQKKKMKKVLIYFQNVKEVNPYTIQWKAIKYHRHNATYKMLLNICYLVIKGLLMTEEEGSKKIGHYIDEQHMHRLYEKFIFAFYKKHYPQFKVSAKHINWNVDDGYVELLPTMKTDITLEYKDKTMIIDTKYYSSILRQHRQFHSKALHSGNMYQIFTYVKNYDVMQSGKVSGALLYAQTDEAIMPDHEYRMAGNKINVKTLDLSGDFEIIKQQLNDLVKELAE